MSSVASAIADEKHVGPKISTLDQLSPLQKKVLVALFCLGQFLEILNTSAILPALPAISQAVGFTESNSVWIFAAYQATFASFLLISGRISDIYGPKPVFVLGSLLFGGGCLGAGFLSDHIGLIILRAIQGIGAAHTIPSSLRMIIQMMPEPKEQQWAIGLFGVAGAIANVIGTILGSLMVQFASWRWICWVIAMVALPAAIGCIFLIPATTRRKGAKISQLDALGVSTLIVAIVLFVYALTTGPISGWKSGGTLAPLFLSLALFVVFFFWESQIDEENAALPPKLWSYPNFAVLIATGFVTSGWYIQMYMTFAPYWQNDLHWPPAIIGVKFLPLGLISCPIFFSGGRLAALGRPKFLIITGLVVILFGTFLLPFSARPHDKYWPIAFPGLVIASAGAASVFILTNIFIFRATPPEKSGTVGAVFNASLQLGKAIVNTATTCVQTFVDQRIERDGTFDGSYFQGRAAALWFFIAWIALGTVGVFMFYRQDQEVNKDVESKSESEAGAGQFAEKH